MALLQWLLRAILTASMTQSYSASAQEDLNGFIGPVVGYAMNISNYAFAFYPSVVLCAQWCDSTSRCMSFSWGDRGNVVLQVTDGTNVYRYGHCVLSSLNRTKAELTSFPDYDFYEETAAGPLPDLNSDAKVPGYVGPFNGTSTSAFDDINADAFEVTSAAACGALCDARPDCRSFDYGARGAALRQCYLSKADRESAGPLFTVWPLYDYYERIMDNIPQTLESRSELSIMAQALARANLNELLSATGPFTLFAPTNDAFHNAGVFSVDDLLALPNHRRVLEYHITLGRFEQALLESGDKLLTAHGEKLEVTTANEQRVQVGGVTIGPTADIECQNGVLHVLQSVLIPPNQVDQESITEMLRTRGLTVLSQALSRTGVAQEMASSTNPWTLFAPSNLAITAFRMTEGLDEEAFLGSSQLRDLLLRHIIADDRVLTGVADDSARQFTAMAGNTLLLERSPGGAYFVQSEMAVAAVGPFDLFATDGILHVVDRMLAEPDRNGTLTGRTSASDASQPETKAAAGMKVLIALVSILIALVFCACVIGSFAVLRRNGDYEMRRTAVQEDGVHVVLGRPVPIVPEPSFEPVLALPRPKTKSGWESNSNSHSNATDPEGGGTGTSSSGPAVYCRAA